MLPKYYRYIISLTLAAFLLIPGGCSHKSGKGLSEEIRNRIKEQLSTDTTKLVAEAFATLDTMKCDNPDRIQKMYGVINRLLFNIYHRGDASQSVKLSRSMIDIMENSDHLTNTDKRQLMNLYIIIGTSFSESGMPSVSLDYYTKGLNLCKDSTDQAYKAMYYNNIGVLYANANILDKASGYFKQALEINLEQNVHQEAFLNYGNLAELYVLQGDLSNAQQAAQKSLDYINGSKNPLLLANMRVQQGDIYTRQQQFDVALLRYNSALEEYLSSGYVSGVVDTQIHLSDLYLHRNMTDSAYSYATAALSKARDTNQPEFVVKALNKLAEVKERTGFYVDAVKHLRESREIEDSLRNVETQLRLDNWEILGYDPVSNADRKGSGLSLSGKYLIISGLITLAVLIAVMIILLYRSRRKRILQEEENHTLATDFAQANREMTALSIEKIKVSESVESICDELRSVLLELNPRETAKRDRIRQLLKSLDNLANDNSDLEFKHFFEKVHPDFYRILLERFPDLTQRDLRLCAFIYLGLNTKEIATITYREVRSVESARNRLRKKLGIENSDDLQAFLQELYSGPAS